jgi:hypothetical protein
LIQADFLPGLILEVRNENVNNVRPSALSLRRLDCESMLRSETGIFTAARAAEIEPAIDSVATDKLPAGKARC